MNQGYFSSFSRRVLALLCVLLPSLVQAQGGSILIRNVNIVQPEENRVLSEQDVLVENGRITLVGDSQASRRADKVIDGSGRYLTPGWSEMHAHIPGVNQGRQTQENTLKLYLANGITTIRGMLGEPSHLALRDDQRRGNAIGPRIYTSGPSFNGNSVTSPEQGAARVREQKAAGYDLLKIHPGLSIDQYAAITDAARDVGIPFGGHVPYPVHVYSALEQGQVTIDHFDGYMRALLAEGSPAHQWPPQWFGMNFTLHTDKEQIAEAVAKTKAAGAWIVPTETLMVHMAGKTTIEDLVARPEMKYMSKAQVTAWADAARNFRATPNFTEEQRKQWLTLRRELLKSMHEAGVGILLGSDAPQIFNVPGFSIHREMVIMVDNGLTPAQVLTAGSAAVAKYFNLDHSGRIENGHNADMVLLRANPLSDISNTRRIEGVMVAGRYYDADTIESWLSDIERQVAAN